MQRAWVLCLISTLFFLPTSTFAQELPQPTTDDLWDVSQGTSITHNSPLFPGFDAHNTFGATFAPQESANTIFSDQQPKGTLHTIEWQTQAPITLETFRLFAYHRTSRPLNSGCTFPDARVRGFEHFRLYAKTDNGDWQQIYELNPLVNGHYKIANEEYQGILQFDRPTSGEPFLHEGTVDPIYAQDFKAEFTQGGDPTDPNQCSLWRNSPGPRVVELDGFGSTEPPEPERQPIVVVPGLLASYNKKLMLKDQLSDNWRFPIGGNFYEGLIEKFEESGFVMGEDLFIAHYDWRQSNTASAVEYLKPMIEHAKQVSGAQKVDVVAHSMGGLVARTYIQGSDYENDIDQLVMLGTPNEGAADAYVAWEGGEFPARWKWYVIFHAKRIEDAMNSHLEVKLSRPHSLREFFPAIKELLPTAQFASREGLFIEPLESNPFLEALHNVIDNLFNNVSLTTIAGTNHSTLDHITLGERTPEDIALERWRDGHPNPDPPPAGSILGDETVLTTSSLLGENQVTLSDISHTSLPEAAQEEIITTLGIEYEEPPIFEYQPPDILVGWVVLSPVNVTVTGPNGEILNQSQNDFGEDNAEYDDDPDDPDDPKVITILNPPPGAYNVTYTGSGEGEYTIITTYADEDDIISTKRSGTTQEGRRESFSVAIGGGSLSVPPEDIAALVDELRDALKDLKHEGHIKPQHFGKLNGAAGHLHGTVKSYENAVKHHGADSDKAQDPFERVKVACSNFRQQFKEHMANGLLDTEAIQTISGLVQQLGDSGIQ